MSANNRLNELAATIERLELRPTGTANLNRSILHHKNDPSRFSVRPAADNNNK